MLRYLANRLEDSAGLKEGDVGMASRPEMQSRMGCDPQVRLPDGRHALLQFKRPPPSGGGMSFKAPSRQASALLKTCPASSFPVLPAVGTNGVSGESGPACPAAPRRRRMDLHAACRQCAGMPPPEAGVRTGRPAAARPCVAAQRPMLARPAKRPECLPATRRYGGNG